MNNDRLKKIKTENEIWIIYLIIIMLSYQSNYYEKDYFITNNSISKNKYKTLNTFIFTMLVLIYTYFEKDAINSFLDKNKSTKVQHYDTLILISTTAVLISGIIFLYIILVDNNIDEEIAFN
ncbi:MAG: hypothetical protein IKE63_01245 [Bacilli bacterium]|nr:hypothetical protein [Bacilli bacterium]